MALSRFGTGDLRAASEAPYIDFGAEFLLDFLTGCPKRACMLVVVVRHSTHARPVKMPDSQSLPRMRRHTTKWMVPEGSSY